MPTQHYDVSSEKIGGRFVGTLSVDIDNVRAWKWKYEGVIIFQSVILQHAQCVNNFKYICTCILFLLNFWNGRVFEKIMKDAFNTATDTWGKLA